MLASGTCPTLAAPCSLTDDALSPWYTSYIKALPVSAWACSSGLAVTGHKAGPQTLLCKLLASGKPPRPDPSLTLVKALPPRFTTTGRRSELLTVVQMPLRAYPSLTFHHWPTGATHPTTCLSSKQVLNLGKSSLCRRLVTDKSQCPPTAVRTIQSDGTQLGTCMLIRMGLIFGSHGSTTGSFDII